MDSVRSAKGRLEAHRKKLHQGTAGSAQGENQRFGKSSRHYHKTASQADEEVFYTKGGFQNLFSVMQASGRNQRLFEPGPGGVVDHTPWSGLKDFYASCKEVFV